MNQVLEAEKGDRLTPHNLHIRLRVVEVVLLLSLILNVVSGYIAMHSQQQVTEVQQQTGVR
jgi:hypothetical protein